MPGLAVESAVPITRRASTVFEHWKKWETV